MTETHEFAKIVKCRVLRITGMKQIIIIAIALLMIPFTAFSMDLMNNGEMDSITGMAGASAIGELNTDQTFENTFQGSVVVAAESNTDQESKNLVHGMTVTHGIEIYVYDVSFDLHIQNISGGGALVAEDILLF